MRENRTYGSEGGEVKLPDPYQGRGEDWDHTRPSAAPSHHPRE